NRSKFDCELRIMSRIRDRNIVNLIGACTLEQPNCLIFEYLKYGDLKRFLQLRCPPRIKIKVTNVTLGCLLYMSSQIGSGMKHLELLGLVHRDLACRNCLVGDSFHVKVSDLGTSHLLHESDYYPQPYSDLLLPVRWMAWESVLMGKFTTKSDVWSFGMTLWEMLNYALLSPYPHLSEEQVCLSNCELFRNHQPTILNPPPSHHHFPPPPPHPTPELPVKPPSCPRELYDLMLHCWSKQKDDRPTFKEIAMFLERKSSGYDPRDDVKWLEIPGISFSAAVAAEEI
ncbi:hypothetical protein HELRODRAFT_78384, partial [Helobdella robusta]|uniref:Protein kinase domain-containing protein n=1 Tax=Helobdella robusta TaxID=6412 RepID=T1G3B3_HELRO